MRSTVFRLPWACAVATIALQIPYPLLHGDTRQSVAIASVLTFVVAILGNILVYRGAVAATAFLLTVGSLSFGVEALGAHTGYPFGTYSYGTGLGPNLAGVPLLVPAAWIMMTWPALVAARRLTAHPLGVPLLTAIGLAGWDLFLDPQMVRDGNWTWSSDTAGAAGLQGIPWTNLAGWLAVGLIIGALTDRLLPRHGARFYGDRALPPTMFLWTYIGSVVANAVFLGRPGVALSGGLGMGLIALPLVWVLVTGRPGLTNTTAESSLYRRHASTLAMR